jgi:UDP-glucose 4-epimerase
MERWEVMMSNVLVTGGAGFMGSHVAAELIKMGHQVLVLDDLSGGFRENVDPSAELLVGSVTDSALIATLFAAHRFEYVYHLAAYAAEGLSHFIKRFNYENNLLGSVNLINASINAGVRCVVFTSSIAVYGTNQVPMHEDLLPVPEDSYGIAKLAVEQELRVSHDMFGLNYVIFRPHNVYGEHQNIGDRYRNVIGIFMNQLMQQQPLTVFGDGTQTRAFTHIADVAPVIAQGAFARQAYGQIFNVGADTPYSVNELASAVGQAMGVRPVITYLPPRHEVLHAFCDHQKLARVFGVRAQVSLAEGLERMAKWAKWIGARQSQHFSHIEIDKHLPAIWRQL